MATQGHRNNVARRALTRAYVWSVGLVLPRPIERGGCGVVGVGGRGGFGGHWETDAVARVGMPVAWTHTGARCVRSAQPNHVRGGVHSMFVRFPSFVFLSPSVCFLLLSACLPVCISVCLFVSPTKTQHLMYFGECCDTSGRFSYPSVSSTGAHPPSLFHLFVFSPLLCLLSLTHTQGSLKPADVNTHY